MSQRMLQTTKFVNALIPVADRYDSDPATDVISMGNAKVCTFVVQTGVVTSGTAVITAEACDNTTPSNATAIPFRYKAFPLAGSASSAVEGDATNATAAGFTTTPDTTSQLYIIEVEDSDLVSDREYVRLQLTEGVNQPVTAGVTAFLTGLNDAGDDIATVLT